jgi:hypothetical protein
MFMILRIIFVFVVFSVLFAFFWPIILAAVVLLIITGVCTAAYVRNRDFYVNGTRYRYFRG